MVEHAKEPSGVGRARYVRETAAANDSDRDAAFTMTRRELGELVRQATETALAQYAGAPLLVDKQTLAERLSCSAGHIDNLRKRGLPTVLVGQSVRFEPAVVLEWLRANSAAVEAEAP